MDSNENRNVTTELWDVTTELVHPAAGVDPNSDYRVLQVDAEGRIYLSAFQFDALIERLDRIEAMLQRHVDALSDGSAEEKMSEPIKTADVGAVCVS